MPLLILMSQVGMIQTMPLDCTGAGVGGVGGGGDSTVFPLKTVDINLE